MGITRCAVHDGLQHITVCCAHVAEAVDAGALERASVVLDGWRDVFVFCAVCQRDSASAVESCMAARRMPAEKWPEDGTDPPHSIVGKTLIWSVEARCCECVKTWYAATGQGDLSIEISAQRDRIDS